MPASVVHPDQPAPLDHKDRVAYRDHQVRRVNVETQVPMDRWVDLVRGEHLDREDRWDRLGRPDKQGL